MKLKSISHNSKIKFRIKSTAMMILLAWGVLSGAILAMLDEYEDAAKWFVDSCHLTAEWNKAIAEIIYDLLNEKITKILKGFSLEFRRKIIFT